MWWLLPLLSTDAQAGKVEREARREARAIDKHMRSLGELNTSYWRALRWGDVTAAAAYLADPMRRTQWVANEATQPSFRVQSAEVLRIEVGPEVTGEPYLREAVSLVQLEGYAPSSQRLEKTTRTQTWQLGPGGWFIETGDEYGTLVPAPE